MSGSKLLAFPENDPPASLEEKLRVENDRRLFGCVGSGAVLAAPWVAWALTVQIILPPIDADPREGGDPGRGSVDTLWVKPPADYHAKLHPPRLAKHSSKPGQEGHKAPKPKTAHPENEPGWLGSNRIGSRTDHPGLNALDLLGHTLKHADLDKLAELPVLRNTPQSRIAGRRGMESHEFNLEYSGDGTGCAADCGPAALPALPEPGTPSLKVAGPSGPRAGASALEYSEENNARSSAAILAVIRAHGPGLRHAYNAFLKRMPGLKGKISLAFSIAPGGDVVELTVASSTTGAPDFDAEIGRLVKAWRFDPVKAPGNDRVTVPFTFSE